MSGVRVIQRKLAYPITAEGSQVSYMLLHLAVPTGSRPDSPEHWAAARHAATRLGVRLSTISLDFERRTGPSQERYLFRFPYYHREDRLASQFADAVLLAASFPHGPFFDDREALGYFRIPISLIRNRKGVFLGELIQIEERRPARDRTTEFPAMVVGSATEFSPYTVATAWRLAPLLYENETYMRAFRFLKTSQENFYVPVGQLENAVEQANATAENVFQQSRLENALQDSFKAVEAVLGDPPKDDGRFLKKIESIGVNPYEGFGLEEKPIYQVIRDMSAARDKKAAHGSTRERAITVGELLIFQNCARYIVLRAAESQLGHSVL